MKHSAKTIAIFSLLFVAGCSSTGGTSSYFPVAGGSPINIESDPVGAEVYVMGEKVGVTPLQINLKDVFPNLYPREKESVYGRVTLKKAGCADITRTVSSEITSSGLREKLDCGDMSSPPSPSPSTTRSSAIQGNVPRGSETVEQRLEKIKELLNKGLIAEDEAKKARERIINEL